MRFLWELEDKSLIRLWMAQMRRKSVRKNRRNLCFFRSLSYFLLSAENQSNIRRKYRDPRFYHFSLFVGSQITCQRVETNDIDNNSLKLDPTLYFLIIISNFISNFALNITFSARNTINFDVRKTEKSELSWNQPWTVSTWIIHAKHILGR